MHFSLLTMVAITHSALHEDQRQRCEGGGTFFVAYIMIEREREAAHLVP